MKAIQVCQLFNLGPFDPVKSLSAKFSCCTRVASHNLSGMVPVKKFPRRSKFIKSLHPCIFGWYGPFEIIAIKCNRLQSNKTSKLRGLSSCNVCPTRGRTYHICCIASHTCPFTFMIRRHQLMLGMLSCSKESLASDLINFS